MDHLLRSAPISRHRHPIFRLRVTSPAMRTIVISHPFIFFSAFNQYFNWRFLVRRPYPAKAIAIAISNLMPIVFSDQTSSSPVTIFVTISPPSTPRWYTSQQPDFTSSLIFSNEFMIFSDPQPASGDGTLISGQFFLLDDDIQQLTAASQSAPFHACQSPHHLQT